MQKTLDFIWEMLVEENVIPAAPETKKLRHRLAELSETLRKDLCDEKTAALDAFLDCLYELHGISETKAFVTGVRFATAYMSEALYAD